MEGSKLYVGNLKYSVTAQELTELFSQFGEVKDATVIEGRGFGFVEMASPEEAEKAMNETNGKDLQGRNLVVNEARPKKDKPRRQFRNY